MTASSSIKHAADATEAVRALIHSTIDGSGYTWPSDIDAALAEIELLAGRLPQAFEQMQRWLDIALRDGRVGDDRIGGSPSATVLDARQGLHLAGNSAKNLADSLRSVRRATSHLTGVLDADDDEEGGR